MRKETGMVRPEVGTEVSTSVVHKRGQEGGLSQEKGRIQEQTTRWGGGRKKDFTYVHICVYVSVGLLDSVCLVCTHMYTDTCVYTIEIVWFSGNDFAANPLSRS